MIKELTCDYCEQPVEELFPTDTGGKICLKCLRSELIKDVKLEEFAEDENESYRA